MNIIVEKVIKAIKEIPTCKGGPGSGSWDSPGHPRFQWQGKKEDEKLSDKRFNIDIEDREEVEQHLKSLNLTMQQIKDLSDLKDAHSIKIRLQSSLNSLYNITEWYDKDDKRIGRMELFICDKENIFNKPKRAELALLKANNTNIGLRKFYREMESKLKKMGVEELELYADISIGKYFWAKEGYNFTDKREFKSMKERMINFTNKRLSSLGIKQHKREEIIKQIDNIKNAKEMAKFDCRIRVKKSEWGCINLEVKDDMVLHLGKAFMLNSFGDDAMSSWTAKKKL